MKKFKYINMAPAGFFRLISLLIVSCLLTVPCFLSAQEEAGVERHPDTLITSVDIFEVEDPFRITLTLDLKKYKKEKFEGKYMKVHALYEVNDTLHIESEIRIRPRGVFRRNHCSMAPFWLNIRKADVKNIHLQEVTKIKVVTNCYGTRAFDDYVLREYLAYKIYNILSPYSFRVRLVQMRYVDTGKNNHVTQGWAFLIEPEEMMAERMDAIVFKDDKLFSSLMKPADIDLVDLFQYMIGNGDYSVVGRHNIKILGPPGFGTAGYTPVPYDFDYSGLVNAAYAVPRAELGISSVKERYYLGLCRDDDAYIAAIGHINQHKEEILELVNNFEYLDAKFKKRTLTYLEEYFSLAEKPKPILYSLKRTCRE